MRIHKRVCLCPRVFPRVCACVYLYLCIHTHDAVNVKDIRKSWKVFLSWQLPLSSFLLCVMSLARSFFWRSLLHPEPIAAVRLSSESETHSRTTQTRSQRNPNAQIRPSPTRSSGLPYAHSFTPHRAVHTHIRIRHTLVIGVSVPRGNTSY